MRIIKKHKQISDQKKCMDISNNQEGVSLYVGLLCSFSPTEDTCGLLYKKEALYSCCDIFIL